MKSFSLRTLCLFVLLLAFLQLLYFKSEAWVLVASECFGYSAELKQAIVFGTESGSVARLDIAHGMRREPIALPWVNRMEVSPNLALGALLVLDQRRTEMVIEIHDLNTGRLISVLEDADGIPHDAFSPSGTEIIARSKGEVYCVYDVASGKANRKLPGEISPPYFLRTGEIANGQIALEGPESIPYCSGKFIVQKPGEFEVQNTQREVLYSSEIFVQKGYRGDLYWNEVDKLLVLSERDDREVQRNSDLAIYRNRRPEEWWGIVFLWEFWPFAVACGAFAWSLLRDRDEFRQARELTVARPVLA